MMRPPLTRVAVAQIDVHPAALVQERSPLADPLFEFERGDRLLGEDGRVPTALRKEHAELAQRVREVYCQQLGLKLEAIVAACRGWKVRVLVLQEYSVPWELLPKLAAEAGDIVVVAGTHAVDRKARRAKVYQALGWPEEQMPQGGTAVAPVLFRGRIVALSAKLGRTQWEPDLKLGSAWKPVEIDGFGPTFGVMICKDFLARERGGQHEAPKRRGHRGATSPRLAHAVIGRARSARWPAQCRPSQGCAPRSGFPLRPARARSQRLDRCRAVAPQAWRT